MVVVLTTVVSSIYLVLIFIYNPLAVQMIFSALFTVMLIIMSFILMRKLRNLFDDFYAEYGCLLWTNLIIQALSLLIMAAVISLFTIAFYDLDKAVHDFRYDLE